MYFAKRFLVAVFILSLFLVLFNFYVHRVKPSAHTSDANNLSPTYSSISSSVKSSAINSSLVSDMQSKNAGQSVWYDIPLSLEDREKIAAIAGADNSKAIFKAVKINLKFLDSIVIGDLVELTIPDAVAVNMQVTKIDEIDGGRAIVGHLSNYAESYYIGFSYDNAGNIIGEITSEKANYNIRTYAGDVVISKVIVDVEKFKQNDF